MSSSKDLLPMRHSLAHILAFAIMSIWPEAQFGIGPTTDDGFYYDINIPNVRISEDNFDEIEQKMRDIINKDYSFKTYQLSIGKAVDWAEKAKQPFKLELLNDLQREGTTNLADLSAAELGTFKQKVSQIDSVSFYQCGDFIDLCRGPHVSSTKKVGSFKLTRISGVYWRGDINKPQLQRIYGVAFNSQQELDSYLLLQQQAKSRDHRKIGQQLDLFVMSDLVGPGLPLFTPRGTILRQELINYSEELQKKAGYEAVWTPHMTKIELYKQSGHYDKYPERFEVRSIESADAFMLKPMNCPHVAQIFAAKPRSYKDMPQRYMETTTMYRDEKSGELHGLSRVRALTQDDSHAFVMPNQIEAEIRSIIVMIKEMYKTLDMSLSVELSFRDDSDKYFGSLEQWHEAEAKMIRIADQEDLQYKIIKGEAAFYGPKIDIHVTDALNRNWQCATVQLDYVQPERFELEYIDKDGKLKRPVMIHKAILGSIERFLSVYIEHCDGKFPVWLAPEQIRIITLNQDEATIAFSDEVKEMAGRLNLRIFIDNDNSFVAKKIKKAELMKIPYTLVIGPKEIESKLVTPRIRHDLKLNQADSLSLKVDEFLNLVRDEVTHRSITSSL